MLLQEFDTVLPPKLYAETSCYVCGLRPQATDKQTCTTVAVVDSFLHCFKHTWTEHNLHVRRVRVVGKMS